MTVLSTRWRFYNFILTKIFTENTKFHLTPSSGNFRYYWNSCYSSLIELDYQIDNVLKIGDEYCHPDPSFNRDECVTKQLLDVKSILKKFMRIETLILQSSIKLFGCIPPALGNYGLPTCKNGSEYPMREVNKLINCPEACTKYTMRLQSESFWGGQIDFPKLTIKFKKQIIVTFDQYSYVWLNLVAEVGGYVGLFLGFSISVFQMTDLVDVLLKGSSMKKRIKRTKQQKTNFVPKFTFFIHFDYLELSLRIWTWSQFTVLSTNSNF